MGMPLAVLVSGKNVRRSFRPAEVHLSVLRHTATARVLLVRYIPRTGDTLNQPLTHPNSSGTANTASL